MIVNAPSRPTAHRWRVVLGATAAISLISSCGHAPDPAATGSLFPVVSVTDGDTITVAIGGVDERVRLIGIDAPELHNPAECFAQESADFAKGMLAGTSVRLVADPSQDDRDKYGRLLRYVFLPDGTDVNATLVASGAPPTTAPLPPDGCVIKGNINTKGEKIYHVSGDDSYDETVITPTKGERYFCSEADAIAAGWRPAKN